MQANAVVDKIGYPEFILNATALNLKYGGVRLVIRCYLWIFVNT